MMAHENPVRTCYHFHVPLSLRHHSVANFMVCYILNTHAYGALSVAFESLVARALPSCLINYDMQESSTWGILHGVTMRRQIQGATGKARNQVKIQVHCNPCTPNLHVSKSHDNDRRSPGSHGALIEGRNWSHIFGFWASLPARDNGSYGCAFTSRPNTASHCFHMLICMLLVFLHAVSPSWSWWVLPSLMSMLIFQHAKTAHSSRAVSLFVQWGLLTWLPYLHLGRIL